ncbi:MAG TPA: hypothetical protein VMH30_09965 [Verrucomicrobiae bacterium]|jgi:hypothetical protein|nr:hypothetical protein [Verrucomicrobiae bacterium]
MRPFQLLLVAGCCAFALAARAQESTNAPATKIENFELQTDTVIVKAFSPIGTINTSAGVVSVRCKQSIDATTGRALYGISVGLTADQLHGFLVVDYDELDALLGGLDYLNKISYDVTPLTAFDAAFTTRSGLRIAAHSERREGGIAIYLQFEGAPRIPLSSDQFSQFQSLIVQAKAALDLIRNRASPP